jgi:hypothetical protein
VTLSGLFEWQGGTRIRYGTHILTVIALDRERNVSQARVTIYHRRIGAHHTHHR